MLINYTYTYKNTNYYYWCDSVSKGMSTLPIIIIIGTYMKGKMDSDIRITNPTYKNFPTIFLNWKMNVLKCLEK